MKSKRCSHNLQSDQQGFYQRICVLIMRITSKTILGILLMNSWDTQIYFFSNYYNFQSVYFEQINVLEKKQKHGGRRRDCFSLLYFGNSQFYCQILCRFSDSVWFSFSVQQFSSAEFGICKIQLRIADKNRRRVELSSSVLLQTLGKLKSLQGTELSVVVVICLLGSF